jgi:hypothetical protein
MEIKESDLFAEYLESIGKEVTSINKDVTSIKKSLEAKSQAKDYGLQLENALAAIQTLGVQVTKLETLVTASASATPTLDVAAFTHVVREEIKRHHPGYMVTKWLQYGAVALIGFALVAGVMTAKWQQAAQDRDRYVRNNWFWRASQQSNRHYANELLKAWHQDSVKLQQKIEQSEADELLLLQADRKKQEETALRAQAAHGKNK